MVEIPLIDYSDPEVIDRQNTTPNAACDVDGEFADVRNLMHLCREQASRIAALEAQLAVRTCGVKDGGLVEFAKEMCLIGFDGGSIDGCDILDTAVEHGLCKVVQYSNAMKNIAFSEYYEEGDPIYVFTEAISPAPEAQQEPVVHPAEQAVTEAMVEAALAEWSKPNDRRDFKDIMRAALKAAMEAKTTENQK